MAKKTAEPTRPPRERAFLVGIELRSEPSLLTLEDSLNELTLLADTAGLDVIGEAYQKLDTPNPNTYIGPGKLEEIKLLVEETLAQVVVFDNELSPRHLRELEEPERSVWMYGSSPPPVKIWKDQLKKALSERTSIIV